MDTRLILNNYRKRSLIQEDSKGIEGDNCAVQLQTENTPSS